MEKDKNVLLTKKMLPILIGPNYEHVMAKAEIVQTPGKVSITIVAEGSHAQFLGDFVAASEIVALSFDGVPVKPISKKES